MVYDVWEPSYDACQEHARRILAAVRGDLVVLAVTEEEKTAAQVSEPSIPEYLSHEAIEGAIFMRILIASIGVISTLVSATVAGQVTRIDEPRGEMLYSTYCIGCHTTQVHWRAKKLATDWTSLKYQVRRWQENIGLGLGEEDVAAVARYLNGLYYHLPSTDTKQSGEADATRRVTASRQD
jgi:mono/diheme cytochrome c family protein